MLAYEIEIDGKKYATTGVEDWSILSLHVTAGRAEPGTPNEEGYIDLSVGGLTIPNTENIRHHFRWVRTPLAIGSSILVRVVDLPTADEPKNRYRSDSEVQENPFTDEEMREMRYRDYLSLKAEFEPDTAS